MNKYLMWVRINPYQTANTVIYAENAWAWVRMPLI